MIRRTAVLLSAMLILALGINYGASGQEGSSTATPAEAKPEGVVSATVITAHGKIVKISKARKQVTLALPDGQEVTLDVRNPHNLDAAKGGAPFVARYYEIVTIRKKKPGESVPSASLKGGIATAKAGGRPGAVGEVHIGLLVSVDAIDQVNGTVTVKAADGTVETVKPRNPVLTHSFPTRRSSDLGISREIGISLEPESGSGAS